MTSILKLCFLNIGKVILKWLYCERHDCVKKNLGGHMSISVQNSSIKASELTLEECKKQVKKFQL